MFGIGMTELLVILVVGLLVLGPQRLPGLARSLGRGLAEFRRASNDLRREFMDVADEVRPVGGTLQDPARGGQADAGGDSTADALDAADAAARAAAEAKASAAAQAAAGETAPGDDEDDTTHRPQPDAGERRDG